MIEWTKSAQDELNRYLAEARTRASASGAEPNEVAEDLRRHVDAELTNLTLAVVTAEDVRRVIARMDLPNDPPQESKPEPKRSRGRRWAKIALIFFGVVLPLAALFTELFTSMCSQLFFDPIPTIGHALLIAVVPIANLLVWLGAQRNWKNRLAVLGGLNGAALAVSLYYTLVFLPIMPFAAIGLIGIIYFGMGLIALLPMSPLFSFIAGIRYRRRLQTTFLGQPSGRVAGTRWGIALAILALIFMTTPDSLTKVGLAMASSNSAAWSNRGIQWLRTVGRGDVLLRSCYQLPSGPADLISMILFAMAPVSTDKTRDIYYRVTGDAFSTRPPPLRGGLFERGRRAQGMEFDFEQGGNVVTGILKGLSLSASRIDGSIDADGGLAYMEWTLVFKNESEWQQREARCQIQLPPNAVVSRLTLWVNGEEREAAFGGRGKVREAYQKVVQRRRDPVLVTTCGPDRILVQCFPVPPRNGEMKIRIGLTTPLILDNPAEGRLPLPFLIERNFKIPADRTHAVWLEAKSPIESTVSALAKESTGNSAYAVRGPVADNELSEAGTFIRVPRDGKLLHAWAKDKIAGDEHIIWQSIRMTTSAAPSKLILVVDGSYRMASQLDALARAIETLPNDLNFSMLFASDAVVELVPWTLSSAATRAQAAEAIRPLRCEGGQDNVPALARAWDAVSSVSNGAIFWIHGPQSFLLGSIEDLRQKFERRPGQVKLYDIQTHVGPNRVIEQLDGLSGIQNIARSSRLEKDVAKLFAEWKADEPHWIFVRESLAEDRRPLDDCKETSDHLARLWAYEQVLRDFLTGDIQHREKAVQLACQYHLVTPVTGAVVLETAQQFEEAGLEPVPPGSVPVVPEPELAALIAVAGTVVLWMIVRRRSSCRAV